MAVPCCGRSLDDCECPDWYRTRAVLIEQNRRDATPSMAADDPRRDELPPF